MTTTPAPLYSEIYVTVGRKGTTYSRLCHGAGRLVRISTASAELSIATGATVYRKTTGASWLLAEPVAGYVA